jgi:hypothetical protein
VIVENGKLLEDLNYGQLIARKMDSVVLRRPGRLTRLAASRPGRGPSASDSQSCQPSVNQPSISANIGRRLGALALVDEQAG